MQNRDSKLEIRNSKPKSPRSFPRKRESTTSWYASFRRGDVARNEF